MKKNSCTVASDAVFSISKNHQKNLNIFHASVLRQKHWNVFMYCLWKRRLSYKDGSRQNIPRLNKTSNASKLSRQCSPVFDAHILVTYWRPALSDKMRMTHPKLILVCSRIQLICLEGSIPILWRVIRAFRLRSIVLFNDNYKIEPRETEQFYST